MCICTDGHINFAPVIYVPTYHIRLTSRPCLITSQGAKAKDRDKARAAKYVAGVPASDNSGGGNPHGSPTPPPAARSCTTLTVTNFSGTRLYKHDLRPTNYIHRHVYTYYTGPEKNNSHSPSTFSKTIF